MKKVIIHVFDIDSSLDQVNRALSTLEGLRNWWTNDVSGLTSKGGVIQFRFASVFKPDMKVVESNESEIVWECVGGEKDWHGDQFIFSLEQADARVKVKFVQEYANAISDEQYGRFNFNWGYYLQSLKLYCETGTGAPFISPPPPSR